jgi:hypothetical protein
MQGCDNGDNLYVWREPKGTVTTAYLLHEADEPQPTWEMRVITNDINRRNLLVTGCDANAHIVW